MSINVHRTLWKIANDLESMNINKNYDVEIFINHLEFQVKQLKFFYDTLVPKQGGNPSKTYYSLKTIPKEHQIIYVNLTRGFPKELYDPHYCYVLKNCGTKLIVIPTTSIKPDSKECKQGFELDIIVKDGENCRLNLDDIRTIDFMRIDERKIYQNVETDRQTIVGFVQKFIV